MDWVANEQEDNGQVDGIHRNNVPHVQAVLRKVIGGGHWRQEGKHSRPFFVGSHVAARHSFLVVPSAGHANMG